MGDDPSRPRWPSRLTPHSSRAVITEGAREIAVDDFIDSHLTERPKTMPPQGQGYDLPEPVTERRGELPRPQQAPAAGWAPAAPPRPGTTAPVRPQVKTVPMQAVQARSQALQASRTLPLHEKDDDEGGGSTMLLTPEQAAAAQAALAAATAGAPAAPPPPQTGHAGTMLIPAVAAPAAAASPLRTAEGGWGGGNSSNSLDAGGSSGGLQPATFIQPAQPQGPAPQAPALPAEPFPESTYVPPKRKGGVGWIIALGVMISVGAGGAFAYSRGLLDLSAKPKEPPSAGPTAEPEEAPAKTDGAPAATATVSSSSSAPASAAASSPVPPSPSGSAAPASPSSSPPPADAKPLLSFEGALTVKSSADAEVVVHGQPVGRTNQRLVVRCGSKNVRLRTDGTKWISPGEHVHVVCMQDTTVTIEPSP